MSWSRIDDRANEHRKQLEAGPEACWFWTCGLLYVNRQDVRDGFIPDAALALLYPVRSPKKLAQKLVAVGLWERVPGGYQVHNYERWNQTREQVQDAKQRARDRAAKSYERRKQKDSAPDSAPQSALQNSDALRDSSGSHPIPSHPIPSEELQQRGDPASGTHALPAQGPIPCPVDLALTDTQRATLESGGNMIPGWAIEVLTARFVGAATADPDELRTLVRWRKSLATAISGNWNDPAKRPKRPELASAEPPDDELTEEQAVASMLKRLGRA